MLAIPIACGRRRLRTRLGPASLCANSSTGLVGGDDILGSVIDDIDQTELRLMGAIERLVSVSSRIRSGGSGRGPDAGDDAIDLLKQVRAGAPEGSRRRQQYEAARPTTRRGAQLQGRAAPSAGC